MKRWGDLFLRQRKNRRTMAGPVKTLTITLTEDDVDNIAYEIKATAEYYGAEPYKKAPFSIYRDDVLTILREHNSMAQRYDSRDPYQELLVRLTMRWAVYYSRSLGYSTDDMMNADEVKYLIGGEPKRLLT